MDYAFLIYASEARFSTTPKGELDAMFAAYGRYTKELLGSGRGQTGAALMPTSSATCVRVRDGKATITDGPFAETKEQLAGFYGFSTEDVDEAIGWAARIPDATNGSVEVRAIPAMPGAPPPVPLAPKPDVANKKYALLLHVDEALWTGRSEKERAAIMGRYKELTADLRRSGRWVAGSGLTASNTAKTVRVRDGARIVSDGPFAETKEQLGGYYLVWARDLDEAIGFAKRVPAADTGTVEIRPVMDIPAQAG